MQGRNHGHVLESKLEGKQLVDALSGCYILTRLRKNLENNLAGTGSPIGFGQFLHFRSSKVLGIPRIPIRTRKFLLTPQGPDLDRHARDGDGGTLGGIRDSAGGIRGNFSKIKGEGQSVQWDTFATL